MKMERKVILSLFAVALAAASTGGLQAQDVTVSLDLFYSDNEDPNSNGTWQLLAKTNDPNNEGLSAVTGSITGMASAIAADGQFKAPSGTTGFLETIDVDGAGAFVDWNADADSDDTTFDFIFGQVQPQGGYEFQLGNSGSSAVYDDELGNVVDTSGMNMDGAVLLAFGKFAAGDSPALGALGANVFTTTDPNTATVVAAPTTTGQVREIFFATLLSGEGDADFDGDVDGFDVDRLAPHFGTPDIHIYQQGDFDGDYDVDGFDVDKLAPNFGRPPPPFPLSGAVAAVPEPTSLALAAGALAMVLGCRRRE